MHKLAAVATVLIAFLTLNAPAAASPSQVVRGSRIALLAQRVVAALPHGADREYVAAAPVADQVVSNGSVDLRTGSPMVTETFVDVPVQIEVDGRLDRTVFVGYRGMRYVETAVAAHDLAPGTVLSTGDVKMARVPFTGRDGNGVDVLLGRRVMNGIVQNQPIPIEATTVNQIVKPGATIVFIVRDGGVAVSSDAIARTGGGLGDQVFVFNPATRKALSGTVTAPGTVELDISGEHS